MKDLDIQLLSQKQVQYFLGIHDPVEYKITTPFIYQGQIPYAGLILIEGKIILRKGKRKLYELFPNSLIAIKEFYFKEPFTYDLIVCENSKIFTIDKELLNDFLTNKSMAINSGIDFETILKSDEVSYI